MVKHSSGFSVIELIFIVVLLSVASVVFFVQKNNIETLARDNTKKTAINTMYYSLEEVFYPTNKYYPRTIGTDNLKSVDPALFTGQNGVKLGMTGSDYTYSPTNCVAEKCAGYTLKAALENEADYVKTSLHN